MSTLTFLSRRDFLKNSSLGLLGFASHPYWLHAEEPMHGMPVLQPRTASANFKPDVELELVCQNTETPILSGKKPAYKNIPQNYYTVLRIA